ncbi:MAG TPA: 3'-5' exonuclease [Anaerolineales bacterium]|nr:3'-5' exonuclease [Anaerolineales bacterium]
MTTSPYETFISVDVETAGPNPSQYSLLSIGACTLDEPRLTFYIELQPVNQAVQPEAQAIHGLDTDRLAEIGTPPAEAMQRFADWLSTVVLPGARPLFVAFNAPFDWMFVNDYFHRFLGSNPFGHTALDVKAYYMGLAGSSWSETSMRVLSKRYLGELALSHHALQDALDQADLFVQILEQHKRLRATDEHR